MRDRIAEFAVITVGIILLAVIAYRKAKGTY